MPSVFLSLPTEFIVITTFIFGVIIGSFLNVLIYRLNTGKSLNGSSHCLSCGTPLKAYELIPLFSYLLLRGKCRTCGSIIPVRYFLVELFTGVLFVGVILTTTDIFLTALFWVVVSLLVVIVTYDLYHFIIPDKLVAVLMFLAIGEQFYLWFGGLTSTEIIYNFSAGVAGALFLFILWFVSKGKWIGFGDIKLILPLGILVGYASVFSLLVLSFWIGAVVGIILLVVQGLLKRGQPHLRFFSRELTIKSAIPFAPFLVLGFLTVFFSNIDVIDLISHVLN